MHRESLDFGTINETYCINLYDMLRLQGMASSQRRAGRDITITRAGAWTQNIMNGLSETLHGRVLEGGLRFDNIVELRRVCTNGLHVQLQAIQAGS